MGVLELMKCYGELWMTIGRQRAGDLVEMFVTMCHIADELALQTDSSEFWMRTNPLPIVFCKISEKIRPTEM
jgi:hypothetical protein